MFGISHEVTGAAVIGDGIGMRWTVAMNQVNIKMI